MKPIHEVLKEKRTQKKITIKDICFKTKISCEDLCALEKGDWKHFHSYAYLRGIVEAYGKILDIPAERLRALLRRDVGEQNPAFVRASSYSKNMLRTPFAFSWKYILPVLIIVVIAGIQLYFSVQKPLLVLKPVTQNIITSKPVVIRGKTKPGVLLYLNEERIYQNDNGEFREELYLRQGKQKFKLKAVGTNGREVVKTFTVTVRKK